MLRSPPAATSCESGRITETSGSFSSLRVSALTAPAASENRSATALVIRQGLGGLAAGVVDLAEDVDGLPLVLYFP